MLQRNRMIIASTTASLMVAAALTISAPAQSGEAGAFIGGVVATKVMSNMRRRTEAEEYQAYSAPRAAQPVQQAAPTAPAAQTTQQKLDELDKLAAGGYITPAEYKAKKKSILDSM